jgi:hypothetical protein
MIRDGFGSFFVFGEVLGEANELNPFLLRESVALLARVGHTFAERMRVPVA